MSDNDTALLFKHIFFPPLDEDDSDLGKTLSDNINKSTDGLPVHPVAAFFERATANQLAKVADWDWDEVVTAAPRVQLSKAFLARSDARLARVAAKIRAFCGAEHEEEALAMVELAKDMLDGERKAFGVA
jgi:hypothetical protein